MMLIRYNWFLFFLICGGLCSCKKYLEAKSQSNLATLSTVETVQLLVDDYVKFQVGILPRDIELGTNTWYLTDANWNALPSANDRLAYTWQKAELGSTNWAGPYQGIFRSNVALDALSKIDGAESHPLYANVRGMALFFRAFYYHSLTQLYTPVYDKTTAVSQLGLPVRTDPDYRLPSVRSNLENTYGFILGELKEAAALLPETPLVQMRPGKAAAYAAIARTYLSMRDYDSAGVYADKSLRLYNVLLNFNSINVTASAPIPVLNKEIIFYAKSISSIHSASVGKIDPTLYSSYDINDLRRTAYFSANTGANAGTYAFKGDYDRASGSYNGYIFGGIATDEVYLMRAECYARAGNTELALKDLNDLLATRWKTGTFVPITAGSAQEVLIKILVERKKELLFRGLRWMDMRRLSKEPQFAETFKRTVNGQEYQLTPESSRFIYLIPSTVIKETGMPQNQ